MLQGESREAIECFEQIQQLVPDDAKLRLRAISFSNLAEYQRFILFPNGSGSSSLEIEARWSSQAFAGKQEQSWIEQLRHVDDQSLQLEARLVFKLLSLLHLVLLKYGTIKCRKALSAMNYPGLSKVLNSKEIT